MSVPHNDNFVRYLAAKKSIDDRSLNFRVWQALASACTARPPGILCVLEVGAGIGTMVERLASHGLLNQAAYTAIDMAEDNITEARRRLADWGVIQGYQIRNEPGASLVLERAGDFLQLHLETIDLFDFIARESSHRRWDLLIAHAFLDLIDIPATLPKLFSLLNPGGMFYFTINFDGLTVFEPAIDPLFDDTILHLYHRTMDERLINGKPSGDSLAGRHLFTHLRQAGARLLAAGASDWVVAPLTGNDSYPGDEANFLHFIIHTIDQEVRNHPEMDQQRFAEWIALRHAQVERGELVYIAHQLDFFGQWMGNMAG